ncbi:MAG: transaldolase [Candidatus Latescibacterota bacterium]|nr:MAG: transaldolase [Candidatus Latescibacterota bacterium]
MIHSSETLQMAHALAPTVHEWVRRGFEPAFGKKRFDTDARWQAVRQAGSELWLDTGDVDGITQLWRSEFSALTTNNTLLNKEVQRGQYDQLVRETAAHLRQREPRIPDALLLLEIAFVLNAWHGLRLVEHFDAFVSVEEHTDLAHDIELAVLYGKRFHAICPERFIVKVPLTAAGLLAMRRLRREGVPINFTLGFSARQNLLAARLGNPDYVNVFLGRLNAFTAESGAGSGAGVGEKATVASQEAIRSLRESGQAATRQIAASMRGGEQVWTLAGTDVLTIPLSVARAYHTSATPPPSGAGPAAAAIETEVSREAARSLRFDVLWDIPDAFRQALDATCAGNVDAMSGADLVAALRRHGATDLFPEYTPDEINAIQQDGKIPKAERWQARLQAGTTSLDSLLNLSGLYSFAADQKQLDDRVRGLLG